MANTSASSIQAPFVELLRLRWVAIGAQALTIAAVALLWRVDLPLFSLFALLGVTVATNVILTRLAAHAGDSWVGPVLLLDVLTLTALLALTGGPSNPFSVLLVLHAMLAAILTGARWTWAVVLASIAGFGLLFVAHWPLPPQLGGHAHHGGHSGHHGGQQAFSAHLQGMWFAYAVTAVTIAAFVSRLAQQFRRAREERDRTARLLGLATLAAGAAHELGNPLATIRVAASELEDQLDRDGQSEDVLADLRLINAEVDRAHAVLERMSVGAGELLGESPTPAELHALLEDLVAGLGTASARVRLSHRGEPRTVRWPVHATKQALQQLLQNALQASEGEVLFEVDAEAGGIALRIEDHGHGMDEHALQHLGEPFFTTRPGTGTGLGVFIARSLIEHLGGTIAFDSTVGRGTTVSIHLPAKVGR